MAVEEQRRTEIDLRRRVTRHEALRAIAAGGVIGATFVVWLVVVLAPAFAWIPVAALIGMAAIAVREWRAVTRLRSEAQPAVRQPTHAEEVAEAVEAIRQRQWDAIADRAFLAAGGTPGGKRRASHGQQVVARPRISVARPDSGAVELDPRWEWQLVRGLGVPDRWVKARCLHTEVERVKSVTGEVVAQLCLTCDTQFPAPRE